MAPARPCSIAPMSDVINWWPTPMYTVRLSANIASSNDNEGRITWLWDNYDSNQQGYHNIIITQQITANPCACFIGFMVFVYRHSRDHYSDVIMGAMASQITRRRSKKTSKLRVTGFCAGNSPVTGEFPAQMASNAENVSIGWPWCPFRSHWWQINPIYRCILVDEPLSGPLNDAS